MENIYRTEKTRLNVQHHIKVLNKRGIEADPQWLLKQIIKIGKMGIITSIAYDCIDSKELSKKFIDELKNQKKFHPDTIREMCGEFYHYL